MCIECHRWKKKSPHCVSTNTVLAILCGRWVNFRPSGSASGLRVHHSVRCNYERLIPGRPVWHFMHDVSPGYLMHSSFKSAATLNSLAFELLATCTHTFCQPQNLFMFKLHSKQVVERLAGCVVVQEGVSPHWSKCKFSQSEEQAEAKTGSCLSSLVATQCEKLWRAYNANGCLLAGVQLCCGRVVLL